MINASADCNRQPGNHKLVRRKIEELLPYLAAPLLNKVLILLYAHKDDKLIPANPPQNITVKNPFLQNPGDSAQNLVACKVAVPVVDTLKIININDKQHAGLILL